MGDGAGRRGRDVVATLAMIAVPAVAIRLLHGMGSDARIRIDLGDPLGWLERTQPIDAIAGVLRLAGLAIAYYVLITTVAYLLAIASGNHGIVRWIRPLTIPALRPVADRLIAGTIAVSALATPLLASSDIESTTAPAAVSALGADVSDSYVPPMYRMTEPHEVTRPVGDGSPAFVGRPTTPPPDPPENTPEPAPEAEAPPPKVRASTVVVEEGDHLWSLAADVVAAELGRPPADHEIAPYWRQVVEHNRASIRSGDPDVIYPGEVIELP